jgi:hypothetical protein
MQGFSKTVLLVVASVLLLLSEVLSVAASECAPLPTRPTNSTNLLQFAIGRDRVQELLSGCQVSDNDSDTSRFARATFLVRTGEVKAALPLLEPLSVTSFDPASLLLADLSVELDPHDSTALEKAIRIYRPLVDRGSLEAVEGMSVAILRARRDAESRHEAVNLLQSGGHL